MEGDCSHIIRLYEAGSLARKRNSLARVTVAVGLDTAQVAEILQFGHMIWRPLKGQSQEDKPVKERAFAGCRRCFRAARTKSPPQKLYSRIQKDYRPPLYYI